ncbi:protein CROC-4-like isoform X4 [Macaca nemestrina]|uniref:protein CROC-4-like isoform X4 n=1 Tax=Macaca nemestrina TaxID=9545 RepID=UPI0039B9BD10
MRPPPAPSLHLPTVTVSFTRRAARERKREASEIPEWIDRCYVIGAASSTPQEARSWGERGSPAAGATRTVSPPHRSLLLTWGGWVLQLPPTLLPPCGRQSHIQHHGQLPGGSTSHCGISTGCTERCLCILLLRTSQVDVMAPQHHQEKFHDLAYSCLGKSFSMSNQDLYGYSTNSLVLGLAWLS